MSTPVELYPLLERFKQRFFCADSMKWCISGTWCTDPLPTRGRISRTNDQERPQLARSNGRRSEARSGRKKPRVFALPSLRVRQNGTARTVVESTASTRGKSVMSLRTRSTFDNTTNTARSYPPLGQDEKSFSKSKSICVSTWRKSPWICAIWTPLGGRNKGKVVFYQAQR